jgi:menaquinone-dependent protoporphyrinogen oxidase
MARILIIFATTEGQTRKIAEQVSSWVREAGHGCDILDSATPNLTLDLTRWDAVIAAASIHVEKHQSSMVHFIRGHLHDLSLLPTLFLSVSLSAIIDDEDHHRDTQKCIDAFVRETGWTPGQSIPVAGAIKYSQYDFFKKSLMRMIARKNGYDTSTGQDYEYTDWSRLHQAIDEFLSKLA